MTSLSQVVVVSQEFLSVSHFPLSNCYQLLPLAIFSVPFKILYYREVVSRVPHQEALFELLGWQRKPLVQLLTPQTLLIKIKQDISTII